MEPVCETFIWKSDDNNFSQYFVLQIIFFFYLNIQWSKAAFTLKKDTNTSPGPRMIRFNILVVRLVNRLLSIMLCKIGITCRNIKKIDELVPFDLVDVVWMFITVTGDMFFQFMQESESYLEKIWMFMMWLNTEPAFVSYCLETFMLHTDWIKKICHHAIYQNIWSVWQEKDQICGTLSLFVIEAYVGICLCRGKTLGASCVYIWIWPRDIKISNLSILTRIRPAVYQVISVDI